MAHAFHGDCLWHAFGLRPAARGVEHGGIVQAVFPEGGLSRDGALRQPKLGLIDYMVRGFDAKQERDVVFIPVGVNYDRVLEDRTLLLEASTATVRPRVTAAIATTLGYIGKNLWLALRNRWQRFGYAAVQFGQPLSLRAWCAEQDVDFRDGTHDERFAKVAQLADILTARVAAIIPVLSVPLIALTLREAPERSWSGLELRAALQARLDRLRADGTRYLIFDVSNSFAIDNAIHMMRVRGMLLENDDCYRLNPAERTLVDYYARSIAHLFADTRA